MSDKGIPCMSADMFAEQKNVTKKYIQLYLQVENKILNEIIFKIDDDIQAAKKADSILIHAPLYYEPPQTDICFHLQVRPIQEINGFFQVNVIQEEIKRSN